jgi:diguanylate cyclase (GGDEF)-like protein
MARSSSPPSAPSASPGEKAETTAAQAAGKVARRTSSKPSRDLNGRVSGMALLRGLVTENLVLRREVAELRLLTVGACHDPMTGLGNRRFLRQRLAEELSRTQRRSEHVGALVLVRVADLRMLARGADRRACLEAVQALAQAFRTILRVADICCRVGFGGFGFLLPDTDAAGAARVVRRLKGAAMRVSAHTSVPVSIAFGTSLWPEGGLTTTKIWARAEHALLSEEIGRGRLPSPSPRVSQGRRRPAARALKVLRGGLASS